MEKEFCIKSLIKEHIGHFALMEEIELLLPFKKETLYKKLKRCPSAVFKQTNGYIIIDVEIFLDYLFL